MSVIVSLKVDTAEVQGVPMLANLSSIPIISFIFAKIGIVDT